MIAERACVAATCYALAALALFLFALIRERGARNYLEFCQLVGLVALWPITITLEATLAWHNRKARQAGPKV